MDELKSFHSSYIEMLTGFPSCSDKGRLFKINNWIFAQSSTSNNWTMANDLKSMIEQDELFRSVIHFIKDVNSNLVDAVLNQVQNILTYQKGEALRDELLLNVTDTNICPETPISYNLIAEFQFVNWLVLSGIARENFKS